jgi:hypothetical protein
MKTLLIAVWLLFAWLCWEALDHLGESDRKVMLWAALFFVMLVVTLAVISMWPDTRPTRKRGPPW